MFFFFKEALQQKKLLTRQHFSGHLLAVYAFVIHFSND